MSDRAKILSELNTRFHKILGNKNLRITENSTAETVDEWDSLCHIQLIASIEQKYNIRFTTLEIQEPKSIASLITKIADKLEKKANNRENSN